MSLSPGRGFPGVDTIWLGQDQMPGQWILMPNTVAEYGWQIQKGYALSGATCRPTGDELVAPVFLVRFWKADDWNYFQQFRKKYLSKPVYSAGGANYAIGIVHPELAALGCLSVVVKRHPAFTNSGKGLWSGTVEFLQYRKPITAVESPPAAIPGLAPPTPASAAAAEQEAAKHEQELQNAWGRE